MSGQYLGKTELEKGKTKPNRKKKKTEFFS